MPFYIIEMPEGCEPCECQHCNKQTMRASNCKSSPISKAVKAEGLGGVFNIPSDGKPSKNVKLWATEEKK